MDVDNCLGNPLHSWVSTKSKAPSPPGLKALDSPGFSQWYPGNPHSAMDQKENLIDKDLSLVVVLPGGIEKMTTVHGSKPLMDLLVTLCAKYHLNPSGHTLELVTANRNNVKLKPNALIGTIEAEKIILKPKGEDKNKKTGSQMPEATVRMVINYKRTQKTILRVNPRVPLAELLPAICEKCEFDVETTVLLRDVQSLAPLDLSSSLNDYAIREVYAKDTKGQPASPVCPASPTHAGTVTPGKDKNQKEKENKGLFSKFRKSKKSSEQVTAASAPASPVLVSKPRPHSMALPSTDLSPLSSPTIPGDAPKKRRAPQPPGPGSNSCPSDPSTRRRINSEPAYHLDSDQMAGISRGSSAESSLKRTKRKAPPPPTSPTVAPDTAPVADNVQEGASAKTLEEIMEQEETPPSLMSATASDTQGEDISISMSADVSLHSPSPDTEMLSTESVEGNEDGQSRDLSSDGNQPQSTVNGSVTLSDVRTAANTGSSDPTDARDGPCQVENVIQQPICKESTSVSAESERSTVASSGSQPATQETQTQASVQANTETPREQSDKLESPVPVGTPCPSGENVQVQTDCTLLPAPPQQHMDEVPSAANATCPESPGKKDMATLTEGLPPPDPEERALSHISDTSSRPASTASVSTNTKPANVYAADSEPKPKPSNELTRDYIPKVGMTTYTIVPQKSLEKLRYFEVALTLETPPAAPEDGLHIGSLHLRESVAPGEHRELHPAGVPREGLPTSTATTRNTVCGSPPESTHSSLLPSPVEKDGKSLSFTSVASQTRSPVEVKETKIPPATKPKPGSFRLPQHKKTPGYYVTSAAEKSMNVGPASPGSVQREALGSPDRAPLSPPLQFQEATAGATNVQLCPVGADKNPAFMRMTRQSSLPCKEPSAGLSLEKLRSFTAPRPYSPATPSRFAQAVSSAVKRSQSLSYRPKSPRSPPISPVTSRPPAPVSKGLFKLKGSENREVDGDKGSVLQSAEAESPSFTGVVKMEGESCP